MRNLLVACLVGTCVSWTAGCGGGGGGNTGAGATGGSGSGASTTGVGGAATGGGGRANGGSTGGSANGGSTGGSANGGSTGGAPTGGSTGTMTSTLTACADGDRQGKVTYYDFADGSGACSFDPTPDDLMVGAMNAPDYMASAACGACAAIHTADGKSITVRIVDLCPECQTGHIDLSPKAFGQLGDLSLGVIPVTWHYVSCDYQGPLQYKFKEGANQWWTAVQIRHHANRVAKFEYKKGDAWVEVARLDYNYFVEDKGMGPGPYTFRVTDIFGQTVEDSGIPFMEGGVVDGKGQFPPCAQ